MISVVIPAFRRPESVAKLLECVFRQKNAEFEVIVVDDHSPDDTSEVIRSRFPQVRLFRNERNCGPAVSRNEGVRQAKGDIIVGFDSDVTVADEHLLSRVLQVFEAHPEAHGIAFRILQPDGRTDDAPRWWHPVPLKDYATREFQTDYFSGTGYAFRRDAMIAAGLYPEVLFMHYEEVGLAFRILDNGGTILYCPELAVLHHEHKVARRSEIKVFYKPRNQILIALMCYPVLRAAWYLAPRLAFQFWTALKGRHLRDFFRALQSAVHLSGESLQHRRPLKRETWRRISALRAQPQT